MKKFSIFLTVFIMLSLVVAFPGNVNAAKKPVVVRQAFTERSPGQFDPGEYVKNQQRLFDWLMAEAVPLTPQSIITVDISAKRIAEIDAETCKTCGDNNSNAQRVRVGLVEPVGHKVNLDGDSLTRTPDGGFVWTAAVESRNATALRVHFTNFSLPENAALYVYNMNGEAFGPYTGLGPGNEGDFWSYTVSGPVAFIQLRHFGPGTLSSTPFVIEDLGYIGPKFLLPFLQKSPGERGDISRTLEHCSYNEWCIEDASCYNNSAVSAAKDAVAYMQWIAGAWIYMCSGGLIADTDTSTQINYFLTANHCVSKAKDAKVLECYFQYKTASCHGACYDPVGAVPRTYGADVVKTGRDGDFSLLRLWEDPPAGSAFLGWDPTDISTADGTPLYRISHPSGAPQAYSQHVVDSDFVVCSGLPVGEFIYSQDVVGATEGGSSGSPVLNSAGQIVGQLYGACGYTLEVCDPEENRTVDGAFAFYYNDVKPWLDPETPPPPEGKMHVASIVLSLKTAGPNNTCKATVTILDEYGNPVEGATVTGTFSGDASGTESGVTGADGEVLISTLVKGTVTTFTFCVDNVTHDTLTYDPTANFVNPPCATY